MDDPRIPDELPAARRKQPEQPAEQDIDRAFQLAHVARGRARAPYSGFTVGAALLTDNGELFPGCNVENASYGLTLCAERAAIAGWTAATDPGERSEVALVVIVTGADQPTAPCGACRQWLVEFAPDATVMAESAIGERRTWTVRDLLPDPFDGESLGAGAPTSP